MDVLTNDVELIGRISADTFDLDGTAVVHGTSVAVSEILKLLRNGYSFERILERHPDLRHIDIQAALAYAEAHVRAAEPDGDDDDPNDDFRDRIVLNPHILVGKPTIKGTRISVALILGQVSGGSTPEQIIDDFPSLTREDVRAAIIYAAEYFDRLTAIPIPSPA